MKTHIKFWVMGLFVSLIVLFLFSYLVAATLECEVTGKIVIWESDEMVDNSIIKVYNNTELVSQGISEDSNYNLAIPCGKYTFVVVYINKDGEKYVDEEEVNIIGNSTFDFMLIPYTNFSELDYEISELEINFSKFSEDKKQDIITSKSNESKSDELILIIAVLLVFIVLISLAVFILVKTKKQEEKEKTQTKEISAEEKKNVEINIKITQGMENIMKALTPNEVKVIKVLLNHNGVLRRNEIARGAEISKSSLAVALTKLEEKKIVEIDRTFVVHNVKITDWFKSL